MSLNIEQIKEAIDILNENSISKDNGTMIWCTTEQFHELAMSGGDWDLTLEETRDFLDSNFMYMGGDSYMIEIPAES